MPEMKTSEKPSTKQKKPKKQNKEKVSKSEKIEREMADVLNALERKPVRPLAAGVGAFGGLTTAVKGGLRSYKHATIVLFFSDNTVRREKATSDTSVWLMTKNEMIEKLHAPLTDRAGNKWYFVREGKATTTDNIQLKRCLYDIMDKNGNIDENKKKTMHGDLAIRKKQYEMTLEVGRSSKFNQPPLWVMIAFIGLGFALGLAYATITFEQGDTIDIENGDYVEEKNENNNQNPPPPNGNGGGTVVIN